jgi:hypothetical protein
MNLIFPVAGNADRFGSTFKPFLKIGDITFIENVFIPFKRWVDDIDAVYFICTQEQENQYNVSSTIKNLISHSNVHIIILDNKTSGPYETLMHGIRKGNITGSSIICDCDHMLDVDEIVTSLNTNEWDAVIPTWSINPGEWMNWSKLVLDQNNTVQMICEKQRIESNEYTVRGIIGCIGFKNVETLFIHDDSTYVSDALRELHSLHKKIKITSPRYAHFFGTPDMLETHINHLRKKCTILCDIDGVLLKHHPHSTNDSESNTLLEGAHTLNEWKQFGHKIILTTARNEKYRQSVINLLSHFNIKYDELVMSLAAGPRILINDHKPSKLFTPQANSIEVNRNDGLCNANISDIISTNDLVLEKTFDGGSFAKTHLVKDSSGELFVRKRIIKNPDVIQHYNILKRQMNDLARFDFMRPGITPKIISSHDSNYEFYYDMEHLAEYKSLADIPSTDRINALKHLFPEMNEFIYSYKREIDGIQWVNNHLTRKIFPKFDMYCTWDPEFNLLINSDHVMINSKMYSGLNNLLRRIDKHKIKPKFTRPIHGDFTFENILWNGSNVKLIDMDGSDYFDAVELDLGKMCQSIFSNYKEWKYLPAPLYNYSETSFECVEEYFNVSMNTDIVDIVSFWQKTLNDDRQTVINKGMFYMCMYFIRFVPFRMKVSKDHGLFAIIMAIVWLTKLVEQESISNEY